LPSSVHATYPAGLDPLQLVVEPFARSDLEDAPGLPVGAGLGDGVGEVAAVPAERGSGEGDRPVLRPLVGIEQEPRLGVRSVRDVKCGVVLEAVVAEERVALADPPGDETRS
jgi:hypothetical protein